MKLIFFDESKNEPSYPYYHLGGICLDETVLIDVERQIQDLAINYFNVCELSESTEFHAVDIFHRKKNFKNWKDFGKRIELLNRFLDVLSLKEVGLIDIQINCEFLTAEHRPEDIAFMFLCERTNDYVLSKKAIGMLIGDRENDQYAARYATSLSCFRARGTNYAYGREIKNLVDSVHFTHSHLSRFLQLADIYTWFLQFRNRHRDSQDEHHKAVFRILNRKDINLFPIKYKEWPKPNCVSPSSLQ